MLERIDALFSKGQKTLPLFPLSNIIFPGGRLALKIFEQRYLELVKTSVAHSTTFGICGIREGNEVGAPAIPFEMGTEVHIVEWDMPQTGIFHIVVEGLGRYIARSWKHQANGLLLAKTETVSAETACEIPHELDLCVRVLKQILSPDMGSAHYEDAVWVGYRLAETLPFKFKVKQDLLEMNDSLMRLRLIEAFLRKNAQ